MSQTIEHDEAQYSVHFVALRAAPDTVPGWGRISNSQVGGKLYMSEWAKGGGSIGEINAALMSSGVQMKFFRSYKPQVGQWCVIDGALLQEAIENGFTIQI